jgi:hypothetical protein
MMPSPAKKANRAKRRAFSFRLPGDAARVTTKNTAPPENRCSRDLRTTGIAARNAYILPGKNK